MAAKSGFRLIEVKSDFRWAWDNNFAHRFDYGISVNELTDTLLYSAATLVCAAALGITHVCIASEAELHENLLVEGITVQHEQFMYSGLTIGALNAMLQRFGITYSSLVAPLYDTQIGALLQTRYADLAHLQASCWMCDEDGTPCGSCGKCTKTALTVFAHGLSPRRVGYDPIAVIEGLAAFKPRENVLPGPFPRVRDQGRWRYDRHRVGLIQRTPTTKVVRAMLFTERSRLLSPRGIRAVLAYHRLRRRLREEAPGPRGLPAGFFAYVDPAIREDVRRILREHFPESEDGGPSESSATRALELVAWIAEPLKDPS